MSTRRQRSQAIAAAGFTLIELAAVMILVAILAVGTTLSLSGQLAAVRRESLLAEIESLDRRARSEAVRRTAAVVLNFDLNSNRIEQRYAGRSAPFRSLSLTPPLSITQFRTRGGRKSGGQVTVYVSPRGQTPDYALQVSSSGSPVWLMACGLSGQVVRVANDTDFESVWAAAGRIDAR